MPTNRPAIIGLRKSVGIKAMSAVFGHSFASNPSSAKAVPIENTLIAKALACSMSVLLIKAINTSSNAKQSIAASVSDTTMPKEVRITEMIPRIL